MKTLIYSMQSGGGSIFSYWLSQQKNCLSIIDLYNNELAPFLDCQNVVIKCTINKHIKIEDHLKSFQPDRVILFLRNPVEIYLSLSEKTYADQGGTIEEKLGILNSLMENKIFDFKIRYEDFICQKIPRDLGCQSYFNFERKIDDIKNFNFSVNDWCRENYRKKWGMGNIHSNQKSLSILKEFKKYDQICSIY